MGRGSFPRMAGAAALVGLQMVTACGAPDTRSIFINEVAALGEARGGFNPSGSDWIELYNASPHSVSLHGCRLDDRAGKQEKAALLPAGTTIGPHGFLIVYFNHDGIGSPVVAKALRSDEEVVFYNRLGRVIDSVDWNEGQSPAGGSYGRASDGGPTFKTFAVPTPGQPNR